MIVPVILAGGSGTRLWPLSREFYPKQLLTLVGNQTMLQNTILRLSGMAEIATPIVVCNENHRFLVAEQLRAIDSQAASIILEPVGRNTAPAIALAALAALMNDDNALLLVLPADHHIQDTESFHAAGRVATRLAEDGFLVTFGVVPASPETGYGYIQRGEAIGGLNGVVDAFKIKRFVEKPGRAKAQQYVDAGDYFWNSGMFAFRALRVLEELERFSPGIVETCRQAYLGGASDLDFYRLDRQAFEDCPSISIDYAVLEKSDYMVTVPLDAGWSDVGSWDALWKISKKDIQENVVTGDVLMHDVTHCYLHSNSRLIAAVGLRDHIVVETSDAIFISPWDRAQDVKLVAQKLKAKQRDETLIHQCVYRPWGSYQSVNMGKRFQVKRITVKPGAVLSLQKHHHRAEHWVVVHGTALVTRGEESFLMKEDESTYIPIGVKHRLENPGKIQLEIIEVQTGSYLGEDDILRFEDVYGR